MSDPLKQTARILRLSLVLIVISAGFAVHAFAAGSNSSNPLPATPIVSSPMKYNDATTGNNPYQYYGSDFGTQYGGRVIVDDAYRGKLIEIDRTKGKYSYVFLDTLKNAGSQTLESELSVHPFPAVGLTVDNMTVNAIGSYTAPFTGTVAKPNSTYATYPDGTRRPVIDFSWTTDVVSDNVVNRAQYGYNTAFIPFVSGQTLTYETKLDFTLAKGSSLADLKCEGYQSPMDYTDKTGRHGLTVASHWAAFPASRYGSVTDTALISRRCIDTSSLVGLIVDEPVVTASTVAPTTIPEASTIPTTVPATNATSPATNATTPATNATVPQATNVTVPQYNGNDAAGNAGNGSHYGALNDVSGQNQPGVQGTHDASSLNAGGTPVAESGQTPVNESSDFVSDVLKNSGVYFPEVAGGLQPAPYVKSVANVDVVNDVLSQDVTPSGSSSRNVEYAIAGLLVLCALTALAANKKFGGASMEPLSNPRVSLSPTGSIETPISLNGNERLYNSHIHLVDLPEQERERELVGVSAASISSGANKARSRAFDPTELDRQALPSRIWNELVSRLTKDHHTIR